MLFREVTAVCPENHTKSVNALRLQNSELLNVKVGGNYS
jgi:hypothetical protein